MYSKDTWKSDICHTKNTSSIQDISPFREFKKNKELNYSVLHQNQKKNNTSENTLRKINTYHGHKLANDKTNYTIKDKNDYKNNSTEDNISQKSYNNKSESQINFDRPENSQNFEKKSEKPLFLI